MTIDSHLFTRLNGATLAYLGDAVIELFVREYLVQTGITDTGALNKMARCFVQATAQSKGVEQILPILTEDELDIYKRGRNSHGIAVPKSASAVEYRRATGLEALFAYLHIKGEKERMQQLFEITYEEVLTTIPNGKDEEKTI